ncbi:hypothetical protein E2C01_061344 [Portunus trituberculatus]|uniref:Uncharacterized protein n=1 Tax=Portunus trituberculatus TaxID=210409 RepID=A0A5B7HE51_PORTR|nr:hypothetical protein [Portunus trituberculatus]
MHGSTVPPQLPKRDIFWGTFYLKAHPLGNRAPSEEAQPTLGPWTGFEPVRLETPRTPKHAWFHCTMVAPVSQIFPTTLMQL